MSCHVMWSCYISYISYIYICLEFATGHEMWPSFRKLELHFWVQPGLQIYQRAVGGKVFRDLSGSQLFFVFAVIGSRCETRICELVQLIAIVDQQNTIGMLSLLMVSIGIVPRISVSFCSNGRDGKNVAAVSQAQYGPLDHADPSGGVALSRKMFAVLLG